MAYDSTVDPRIEKLQRLLTLANTLDHVTPERYNQRWFRKQQWECGSICCALGWATEAHGVEWGLKFTFMGSVDLTGPVPAHDSYEAAAAVFGITHDESYALFNAYGSRHRKHAAARGLTEFAWVSGQRIEEQKTLTPAVVAASIRDFVTEKVDSIIKENV